MSDQSATQNFLDKISSPAPEALFKCEVQPNPDFVSLQRAMPKIPGAFSEIATIEFREDASCRGATKRRELFLSRLLERLNAPARCKPKPHERFHITKIIEDFDCATLTLGQKLPSGAYEDFLTITCRSGEKLTCRDTIRAASFQLGHDLDLILARRNRRLPPQFPTPTPAN